MTLPVRMPNYRPFPAGFSFLGCCHAQEHQKGPDAAGGSGVFAQEEESPEGGEEGIQGAEETGVLCGNVLLGHRLERKSEGRAQEGQCQKGTDGEGIRRDDRRFEGRRR